MLTDAHLGPPQRGPQPNKSSGIIHAGLPEGHVQFDEYVTLHDEILDMMQDFYNQIENSAFTGGYRKK